MSKYYEDFELGQRYVTPGRTIDQYEVSAFAGLSGDYNPIHTDVQFAGSTRYQQPIAHGVLGLSIATGLISRTGLFDGTAVAFLGLKEWNFVKPILFGDTIHVEFEITQMRETSNPETGIITRTVELINQHADVLQKGEMVLMIKRRPNDRPLPTKETGASHVHA